MTVALRSRYTSLIEASQMTASKAIAIYPYKIPRH